MVALGYLPENSTSLTGYYLNSIESWKSRLYARRLRVQSLQGYSTRHTLHTSRRLWCTCLHLTFCPVLRAGTLCYDAATSSHSTRCIAVFDVGADCVDMPRLLGGGGGHVQTCILKTQYT